MYFGDFLCFYFFLLLTCHTTIPTIIIAIGIAKIIILTIKSSCSVGEIVTVLVLFLIVIVSSLSVKYATEFNAKSLLLFLSIGYNC